MVKVTLFHMDFAADQLEVNVSCEIRRRHLLRSEQKVTHKILCLRLQMMKSSGGATMVIGRLPPPYFLPPPRFPPK